MAGLSRSPLLEPDPGQPAAAGRSHQPPAARHVTNRLERHQPPGASGMNILSALAMCPLKRTPQDAGFAPASSVRGDAVAVLRVRSEEVATSPLGPRASRPLLPPGRIARIPQGCRLGVGRWAPGVGCAGGADVGGSGSGSAGWRAAASAQPALAGFPNSARAVHSRAAARAGPPPFALSCGARHGDCGHGMGQSRVSAFV